MSDGSSGDGLTAARYASELPVPGGLGGSEPAVAGEFHLPRLFRRCSYWLPLVAGGLAAAYVAASGRAVPAELPTDAGREP